MPSQLCQGFCCSAQGHKSRGSLFTTHQQQDQPPTQKTAEGLRYFRAASIHETHLEKAGARADFVPGRGKQLQSQQGWREMSPAKGRACSRGTGTLTLPAQQEHPSPVVRGKLWPRTVKIWRCRASELVPKRDWHMVSSIVAVEPELPGA